MVPNWVGQIARGTLLQPALPCRQCAAAWVPLTGERPGLLLLLLLPQPLLLLLPHWSEPNRGCSRQALPSPAPPAASATAPPITGR